MEQKENEWDEHEEYMFRQWMEEEKKEWEDLAYSYEETPLGIEQKSIRSVWCHKLYDFIKDHTEEYHYFYAYYFENLNGRTYFVEVGYEGIQFRISVLITKKEFRARLRFKEGDSEYYPFETHALIDHGVKLAPLLTLYEKIKTFVLTKAPERLAIMMEGRKLEEEDVKVYKIEGNE